MASMEILPFGRKYPPPSILDRPNQFSKFYNPIYLIPNCKYKNPISLRVSASSVSSALSDRQGSCFTRLNTVKNQEDWGIVDKDSIFTADVDGWVKGSVVEIVKNLKKAPLLVSVYCNNKGGLMEVTTEHCVAEDWPNLKREWSEGERQSPDGIILVEELKGGIGEEEDDDDDRGENGTKIWGLLIQCLGGREQCGPSCYLLETCRVNNGVGLFGTHFSLVKVTSFRETAFSQIRNSWLLQ